MRFLDILFRPGRAAELNTDQAVRDEIADTLDDLSGDELLLVRLSVERLTAGRRVYGQWNIAGDKRDMDREALEEAIDLAHYIAARLLQTGRKP